MDYSGGQGTLIHEEKKLRSKILCQTPFKGIKLALKNLGRFSLPTVSRAVLKDKYQHFDQYLKYTRIR